ncbi:peptide deformylase [Brevirhabdus pacifica]|uniref:Peptide deformylase-like n=1 Tax=Brevirhabdus pacifica TaxID=1267768 RepID=A0A1U7DJ92_9RHOB|nr:peptide deformylase [Brevirhabdus pacifica]APX90077.1 peptide deformylase [Brevirhabdus pacifica]OWU75333.1 peptide deformylase [Loktanella sp. 22II-4b]PJJ82670.1 peptide deformylase [Brevirhabdus pacifica]
MKRHLGTPRPFVPWPDPRLRTPAEPVGTVDEAVHQILADMVATMVAMPGVGLAAPQIGVMRRLAVVDATGTGDEAVLMADPVLIAASDRMRRHEEASPNLPGVSARLERPEWVEIGYLDPEGARVTRRFEGLWSTSAQHQLDHLEGRMYFDRLSRLKRDMLLRKARKEIG